MYTNQPLMGALVHTIKTKFINKFSPTGGCLLLKETVITERRGDGGDGEGGCRTKHKGALASLMSGKWVCLSEVHAHAELMLPPEAINRCEF